MISFHLLGRLAIAATVATSLIRAAEPQSLDQTLEPYLKKFGLPAIAAAVFQKGELLATGTAGTRRAGTNTPVKIDDRFHLGSDSKAFTALLAAQFVEAGKLRWNSTLADVFPELKEKMTAGAAEITLQELLSHTSGLTDTPARLTLLQQSFEQEGNLDDVRYWIVKETASKPIDHARGVKFDYSNIGYTIAGAMLERVGKKTWEELILEKIAEPLDLKTTSFGPQSSLGKIDAPVGHIVFNEKLKPMLAGPNGDNPVVIGPAGTMNMSVLDFAKWVAWHASGGKRAPALVTPATVKKLHTPIVSTGIREDAPPGTPKTGEYALGWAKVAYDWATSPAITHNGSNNMNLANATFWPDSDFGFVIMTNVGGPAADEALRKLAVDLYKTFAKK